MLTGAAPVFTVANLAASLAYYQDALGFDVTFQWGTPTSYACLCRDEVQLHLAAATVSPGKLCIFVRDVDAIHAELTTSGATILTPPQTQAYGMRDFNVADPDGNILIFGMAAE